MSGELPDIRALFLEEAGELSVRACELLAAHGLSARVDGPIAGWQECVRCIHSIKGAAAHIGLQSLAEYCAALENHLKAAGETAVAGAADQAVVPPLASGVLFLRYWLELLGRELSPPASLVQGMLAQLSPQRLRISDKEPLWVIRFSLNRLLSGAEMLIEILFEDLRQRGTLEEILPPQSSEDEGVWRLRYRSALPEQALRECFKTLADPASLELKPALEPAAGASLRIRTERAAQLGPNTVIEHSLLAESDELDSAAAQREAAVTNWQTFRIGEIWFALALDSVLSVRAEYELLQVPGALPGVAHCMVHEEHLVPVVNLPSLMALQAEAGSAVMLVLAQENERWIALGCDEVGPAITEEVARLSPANPDGLPGLPISSLALQDRDRLVWVLYVDAVLAWVQQRSLMWARHHTGLAEAGVQSVGANPGAQPRRSRSATVFSKQSRNPGFKRMMEHEWELTER